MQELIKTLQEKLDSMGIKTDLSTLDTSAIMSKMSNMGDMKNEIISQLSSKFGIDNGIATKVVESINMEGITKTGEELTAKTGQSFNGMDQVNGLVDKVKGFFAGK